MQNLLINSLKSIAERDIFKEKILICPTFVQGNQILESFSRANNNWINFKTSTIQAMAADLAEAEICRKNLKIISMAETVFLVDRIFTESDVLGELKYFEKHALNTGIINAITESLMELKFAGIGYSQIEDSYFIKPAKAQGIRQIYAKYECYLKENFLVDTADIIVLATGKTPEENSEKIYIALARYGYKKIEKDFLTAFCGGNLVVIGEEKVFGLERPENRLAPTDIQDPGNINTENPAFNKFSHLFDLDSDGQKINKMADIGFFCAQNYKDEIYAILSRLAGSKNTVDDTEIIYISTEPYLDVIYSLCQRLNIPVAISEGIPGEKSICGKALKGFLLWIREDFPELYLRNLFKYGLLKINSDGQEYDLEDRPDNIKSSTNDSESRDNKNFDNKIEPGKIDNSPLENKPDIIKSSLWDNKPGNIEIFPQESDPDNTEGFFSEIGSDNTKGSSPANEYSSGVFEKLRLNGVAFASALRESKIGWGRQRYIPVLEKSIADIRIKLNENSYKGSAYWQGRLSILESLKKHITGLLDIIPEIKNGKVDFTSFCNCCQAFLSDFVSVKDEKEASFLANLKQRLKTLKLVIVGEVPVEEAVQKIIELVKNSRFLSSGPKPGHLFVSDLTGGGLSGRSNTYIVGMDDHKFPGTAMQDPILLDGERRKISSGLAVSKEKIKERLYDFTAMLAAIKGKVTFSFSVFDIKDERNLFASSVLLQIYRLKSGSFSADYTEMLKYLGQPAGYGQDQKDYPPVDTNYRWLDKLLSGSRIRNAKDSVLNIYPGLSNGIKALNCRSESGLTCFDGFIGTGDCRFTERLDPRNNSSFILSCTGIESYAQSPYAFFLNHILKVKRPEEIKKDMTLWLDSKNKGILLHDVFEDFTRQMIDRGKYSGVYPDIEEQKIIMEGILENAIEKYIKEIPCPGEYVFNRELLQLKKDAGIFIGVNDELGNPYLAEFDFGSHGKEPMKLYIGKGPHEKNTKKEDPCIYLSGRIDRIDFDIDRTNEYHVWDYKTGSSGGYEEDGFICKGRQMQHVLYAKIAEEILKSKNPDSKVTKCGYVFPTEKGMDSGKGCIIARDPGREDLWQEALGYILDLISAGVFIISDEDNPPYMDNDDIYGGPTEKKGMKEKLKNSENSVLEKWNLLKKLK